MTTATDTRSTAKLDHAQPVAALLAEVRTVADADQLRPVLVRRLEEAQAAAAAHGEPDELAEDGELLAHAEKGDRLAREVTRYQVALERLDALRAELVIADKRTRARQAIADALPAAEVAEAIAAKEYPAAVALLAALLDRQDQSQDQVREARRLAAEAGIAEEAEVLRLPHERRSQGPRFEMVEEAIAPPRNPRVLDGNGRELGSGGGQHFGPKETAPATRTRQVERQVAPGNRAPDLAAIRIVLPSPESVGVAILDRGRD